MDEKLSIYDIAEILTAKTGREKADIETFIETLIAVINDVITHNGVVRIKGIGSFKVIPVKERESIHVNTGERIVIPAHHKLSFLPDKILKEKINRPFAFFEAIETNETENNETASSGLSNDDEEDENDEPITAEEPVQKPVREVTKATEDIAPKTEENPAPLSVLPSEDETKEEQKTMNKEIDEESDREWSEERAIGSHRASAANRETLQKSTIIPIKQEIMSENNERKEQHVNETPKSHPVAKPVVKKKKKETSNASLYVILALLLLLLGGESSIISTMIVYRTTNSTAQRSSRYNRQTIRFFCPVTPPRCKSRKTVKTSIRLGGLHPERTKAPQHRRSLQLRLRGKSKQLLQHRHHPRKQLLNRRSQQQTLPPRRIITLWHV